jgi:glycerol-3-phosphate dehydrogenase
MQINLMTKVDVIIFGGGIAGLWTLARLTNQGYNALLLETEALGAGQTIKSQGIIHGGLKYALSGQVDAAVTSLQDMPTVWQQCLHGNGEIDLSAVTVLANGQHMWSANKLTGGITTLFASSAMKSQVDSVPESEWPTALAGATISSKLYKLEEPVLDIRSLLQALAEKLQSRCIKIDAIDGFKLETDSNNNIKSITLKTNNVITELTAQRYIFTAGSGNAAIIQELQDIPAMQLRPLQMVIVKSANLMPLYGHCIGMGTTPRITITTHNAHDQTPVWYLGGKIAEEGINRTREEQITVAKQELAALFPNIDLSNAEFASFYVDRAEAKQANGSKPNSTTLFSNNNYITAWPTKLAFAPLLAQQILDQLQQSGVKPSHAAVPEIINNLPHPNVAIPIWDQLL